jgi:hypothetical protein
MFWTCKALLGFYVVLLDVNMLWLLVTVAVISILLKIVIALHYFDVVYSFVSGKKPSILYAKCISVSDTDTPHLLFSSTTKFLKQQP